MKHISQALDDSFDDLDRALADMAPEQAQRLRKLRRNRVNQIGFDRDLALVTRVAGYRNCHNLPLRPAAKENVRED